MSYKELFLSADPKVSLNLGSGKPAVKIFGVPFDATASFRPGARFGPNAIRQAFQNIEIYSRPLEVDLEALPLEDLGNLHHTSSAEDMTKAVQGVVKELVSEKTTFAMLGGEHTITLASYGSLPKKTALVIFDAHLDLRDEYGGVKLNHATFLRRLVEAKETDRIIHVGSRAATPREWNFANEAGLSVFSSDMLFTLNHPEKILSDIMKDVNEAYVSVDLDVLDPAYAPGVSNPEPAGIATRQLLELIYSLKGKRIVGFDVVELCPPYDSGSSAAAAAKVLAELSCLSVAKG